MLCRNTNAHLRKGRNAALGITSEMDKAEKQGEENLGEFDDDKDDGIGGLAIKLDEPSMGAYDSGTPNPNFNSKTGLLRGANRGTNDSQLKRQSPRLITDGEEDKEIELTDL